MAALLLAGCTNDPIAQQYLDGSDKGYIAGDGSVIEIAPADRQKLGEFEAPLLGGGTFDSSKDFGEVTVVNFWYAACPPCRVEAPDLEKVYDSFADKGVEFFGVNTHDQEATARSFTKEFGVEFPIALDADSGAVQLAFAGRGAAKATPSTVVIDSEGRVSSIVGQVEPSTLTALITTALNPAAS
jgi:peroxiredoxin